MTDEFKPTSAVLNISVTDQASLSSHLRLQTAHISHHLEIEQDPPRVVDITFDLMLLSLWPPSWPFLPLLCCVNSSSPVPLHAAALPGDNTQRQGANPGRGLLPHPHLLRLQGDDLGVQEGRCAVFPSGASSKCWPKLSNRAKRRHIQRFDPAERELEAHGGVPVRWSTHWRN